MTADMAINSIIESCPKGLSSNEIINHISGGGLMNKNLLAVICIISTFLLFACQGSNVPEKPKQEEPPQKPAAEKMTEEKQEIPEFKSFREVLKQNLPQTDIATAADTRRAFDEKNSQIINEFLQSEKCMAAYKGAMEIMGKNIQEVSSKGYYDTLSITFINQPGKALRSMLRPLTDTQRQVLRWMAIETLMAKGYKIGFNDYWEMDDNFNIRISW
jgi:hypothetical protein